MPYPVVYYPNGYGTFFAFGADELSKPALCLCAKPAIESLIRLKKQNPTPQNVNPLRMVIFDSWFFPSIIASAPLKDKHNPIESLSFVEGLCHRCNLVTPSLRYCHEMYGGEFIQHFGWYYNQAYLRLGIYPMHFFYLEDVCLPEYQNEVDSFKSARAEYRKEYDRFLALPSRRQTEEAKTNVKKLQKIATKKERAFTTKIENIVRQEFGVRNVGEGWVSETILYQIVSGIFTEQEVLRHHRPDWLGGLELDVFIPSLKLGFEYQGQQHFHPIERWGGVKGLQDLQERDRRKAKLCANYGVDLVTVDYTEPLTEDYIRTILGAKGMLFPSLER
ncbi:MAG: hypothetical protein ACXVIU_06670 [Halobacteriota archaeon]